MINSTQVVEPSQFLEIKQEIKKEFHTVIVPTRNEAENIAILLSRIKNACGDTHIEVIFVDDSTDNTPQVIINSAKNFSPLIVNLIHRPPERRLGGLGGAVVEGLKAAHSEYVCVMDGDLQHPPELLPILFEKALKENADIVIATRRCEGSECEGLNVFRDLASKGLDLLGRIFFLKELRGVSDPLTGFFLVRVKALNLETFRPNGFKILMEILVRNPKLIKEEIPFHFEDRYAGQSKASVLEVWKYFCLLWALRFGEGSLRFAKFALVGLSGIAVNLVVLFLVTDIFNIYYIFSAGFATLASTLWNFGLTEFWVYPQESIQMKWVNRLGWFLLMNIVALFLRTPLLYVLTSVFGIYYVISNLISLAVMTVSRFFLADNVIWKKSIPIISRGSTNIEN